MSVVSGVGFVRVSSGSQDEASQVQTIIAYAIAHYITIVKWVKLHGYSASAGKQEPALREVIADIDRGDYTTIIVTDSSRLDRREDLDAQWEILLAVRGAGGDVISIDEPQFGKTDFAGRIITLAAQNANAEKSKTVKNQIYRGITMIRDNNAHRGTLPAFWEARGVRYSKQAHCVNPEAVKKVYERVADGESLSNVGRDYNMWPQSVKNLIRFPAHHTGVIECSYTHKGVTETWTHKVEPVIDSALWWRANKVLVANMTDARENRGGRPVAVPSNWISGVLDCPECGGKLLLNTGKTPAGNPRTPSLVCRGHKVQRTACGRFKGRAAQPIIAAIESVFSEDETPIEAFRRTSGNTHELDNLKADLARIQGRLSATDDDDELDQLIAERKAVKASIETLVIMPDSFAYAPTGQTISGMWKIAGTVKRAAMVRAFKNAGLITLTADGRIVTGEMEPGLGHIGDGIVDLGAGLCFRRYTFTGDHSADVWLI